MLISSLAERFSLSPALKETVASTTGKAWKQISEKVNSLVSKISAWNLDGTERFCLGAIGVLLTLRSIAHFHEVQQVKNSLPQKPELPDLTDLINDTPITAAEQDSQKAYGKYELARANSWLATIALVGGVIATATALTLQVKASRIA